MSRDLVAVEPRPCTPEEHIALLEQFLVERLEHAAIHPVVASVLAELERKRGTPDARHRPVLWSHAG